MIQLYPRICPDCARRNPERQTPNVFPTMQIQTPEAQTPEPVKPPTPLWFKEAIIYQLHIKTFCDANTDGIGDFQGLLSRLDYLKNLGVTAIWLLPFYPSPHGDERNDISDDSTVNQSYDACE